MRLTSRRALIAKPNDPIEVWEHPVPEPAAGEALVRVQFAGVCGTDVHLWRGEIPLPGPIVLGHEGVATIEQLGDGVCTDFAGVPVEPGDRVFWVPLLPCQRCYECTIARVPAQCAHAFDGLFGDAAEPPTNCYTELARLPARMPFFRIPDDTPSEAVIAFGCAMPTMLQGLERLGPIEIGQTVVIQGAGPVGLAATLLAHAAGAGQVIVIGAPRARLVMAQRLGASTTISLDVAAEERLGLVRELTGGRGAEIVIEAAGAVQAFAEGIELLAPSGRYLIVGLWSTPGTVPVEPRYLNNMNLRIIGTAIYAARHIHQAVQVAGRHHRELGLADAITHRFALDQSQQALEAVAGLNAVKAVVLPNG